MLFRVVDFGGVPDQSWWWYGRFVRIDKVLSIRHGKQVWFNGSYKDNWIDLWLGQLRL